VIGHTLAYYRIAAALGAGGMGEVYRATDTMLGRDVAIKVLPAELAQDPERRARFEREAKPLASLNHPNIAHVYGFETVTPAPLPPISRHPPPALTPAPAPASSSDGAVGTPH